MKWRRVRVGDIIRLDREFITIDPLASYRVAGVRSFGRGIFYYLPQLGATLGKLRYFELRSGALVLSNIKAWEGAVAVSTDRDAGCVASNRFLTYYPIDP